MKKLNTTEIKVFLASPSNILSLRNNIQKFVEGEFSRDYIEHKYEGRLKIKVERWEQLPANIGNGQSKIFADKLPDSDILIAVFWDKYGELTVKEIMRFIESEKPVMIYFINEIRGSVQDILANREEFDKISKLKKDIETIVMYKEIANSNELLDIINSDLPHTLEDVLRKHKQRHTPIKLPNLKTSLELIEPWFEISVNKTMNQMMQSKLLESGFVDLVDNIKFYKSMNHFENLKFWKEFIPASKYATIIKVANEVRESAFSKKFGNYNYDTDLRNKYKDWAEPIRKYIANHPISKNKNDLQILSVASNYGKELEEIFPNLRLKNCKHKIKVLEICEYAIQRGREYFSNISKVQFSHGLMEEILDEPRTFDIYLNLRSIHSRGVGIDDTVLEAHRVLKNGGLAIISVSNGYLIRQDDNPKNPLKEQLGMYDSSKNFFSEDQPNTVALNIKSILRKFQFENVLVQSNNTEIIIFGTK